MHVDSGHLSAILGDPPLSLSTIKDQTSRFRPAAQLIGIDI
ncbi:MAG: hypothetical protein VXA46_02960 [Aquiluna sp.]